MEFFIRLILALPLEKVAVYLYFQKYLSENEKIIKPLLLASAREQKVTFADEKELFADFFSIEEKKASEEVFSIWQAESKEAFGEDNRLEWLINLLKAEKYDDVRVTLKKQLEGLNKLFEKYKYFSAAASLAISLSVALEFIEKNTVKTRKKTIICKQEDHAGRLETILMQLDFYYVLLHKESVKENIILSLLKFNYKLQLLQQMLEIHKEKQFDADIQQLKNCLYDPAKNIGERLKNFLQLAKQCHAKADELKLTDENTRQSAKLFLKNMIDECEKKLTTPSSTGWWSMFTLQYWWPPSAAAAPAPATKKP